MCPLVNMGNSEGVESGGGQVVQRCISGQTHVQRMNVVQVLSGNDRKSGQLFRRLESLADTRRRMTMEWVFL